MTVYYVARSVQPGDRVHYMHVSIMPHRDQNQPIVLIEHTEHGDHRGTVVERSNQRVILRDEEASKLVVTLYGSWGASSLAYIPLDPDHPEDRDSAPEPLRDIIAALAHVGTLDDSDLSELERELEAKAWDDEGRRKFREALESLLDEIDPAFLHNTSEVAKVPTCQDEAIDRLWYAGCGAYGIAGGSGYTIDPGCAVLFDVKAWIEHARKTPGGAAQHDAHHGTGTVPTLAELAEVMRTGAS